MNKQMQLIYTALFVTLLSVPAIVLGDGDPDSLSPDDSTNQASTEKDTEKQFWFSDKTAEFTYQQNESVFGLKNDHTSVSILFNEERDNVITGAIMYDANTDFLTGLKFSFGTKIYAGLLAQENNDVVGIAASLQASYTLPNEQLPLKLSASFSYAPDILTFGQSDRIIDWYVRAGVPLNDSIEGFIGYRFLQFDTRPGDREVEKRVHVGIRW